MTELEVCRLSAEALGFERCKGSLQGRGEIEMRYYRRPNGGEFLMLHWNPLTNAEQRWECVEWLIAQGCALRIGRGIVHHVEILDLTHSDLWIECLAAEFPARAAAELQRRRK